MMQSQISFLSYGFEKINQFNYLMPTNIINACIAAVPKIQAKEFIFDGLASSSEQDIKPSPSC